MFQFQQLGMRFRRRDFEFIFTIHLRLSPRHLTHSIQHWKWEFCGLWRSEEKWRKLQSSHNRGKPHHVLLPEKNTQCLPCPWIVVVNDKQRRVDDSVYQKLKQFLGWVSLYSLLPFCAAVVVVIIVLVKITLSCQDVELLLFRVDDPIKPQRYIEEVQRPGQTKGWMEGGREM